MRNRRSVLALVQGDVIDAAERGDGLLLKLVAMDSGKFRVYMCNPPGLIEAREYKGEDEARKDFDRIKRQTHWQEQSA